jgi:hypothetical protein
MGPIDAAWHLLGLFAPALLLGAIAAGAAKLLWRAELKAVPWRRLATWAAAAAALATVLGLALTGRDGRMLTYAAMVAAATLALWWAGFAAPRR